MIFSRMRVAMSHHDLRQVRELFEEICDLTPADRERYLDENKADGQLRLLLERLLEADSLTQNRQPLGTKAKLTEFAAGDVVDDFLILSRLGSGGFATVYLAQQKSRQRRVALKISTHSSHEASVLSSLDHPHIVRVYDERVLPDRGLHLLYMQYVPGGDLQQVISFIKNIEPSRRNGTGFQQAIAAHLSSRENAHAEPIRLACLNQPDWPTTTCWIGARLADALYHAHTQKVWHRDIKPANVLLTADGLPMLADFNTSFGSQVVGATPDDYLGASPPYMSPEQCEVLLGQRDASDIGPASDLYSLGILLWELASGDCPVNPDVGENRTRETKLNAIYDQRRQFNLPEYPEFFPRGLQLVLSDCLGPNRATQGQCAATTAAIARRLQLCTNKQISDLLHPSPASWTNWAAQRPIVALMVCGLVPNVAMALVNGLYLYHFLYAGQNVTNFFYQHYSGVVCISFLLAIGILLWYVGPVVTALRQSTSVHVTSEGPPEVARRRCLNLGLAFWVVILAFWMSTGVIYPFLIWKAATVSDDFPTQITMHFFLAQLLHGLIASSGTYLLVTLIATRSFFPRLSRGADDPSALRLVDRLRTLTDFQTRILAVVPPLSLIALASFGFYNSKLLNPELLLSLGLFGTFAYACSLILGPMIHATLNWLITSLKPTSELLYGAWAAR
jgi:serine/threonine protein kinase